MLSEVYINICDEISDLTQLSDIFVHKLILVLVSMPFGLHNFSSMFLFYAWILVLVFIQFYENNFSFYLILVLV